MSNGFSRSPKLLKGAIIQFSAPMLVPIPNIIVFQYNPETLSRSFTPWSPIERQYEYSKTGEAKAAELTGQQINALSQPFDPSETFSVTLDLDATDALEFPESHPVALVSGVADRIAALEMLLYPPGDSGIGSLLNVSVDVSIGGGNGFKPTTGTAAKEAQRKSVPIVLFFWGPGRIVPVRITGFSVEEQAFSPVLYPIRAKVTVGMRILDENDLVTVEGVMPDSETASVKLAKACYKVYRAQKEALATANIANTVESIMGMLPF